VDSVTQVLPALKAWRALLGDAVLDADAAGRIYGADCGGARRTLLGALHLASDDKDKLPEILAIARRYRVPLYPISTGRNWGYGTSLPTAPEAVLLDLSRMNRILDFDPEFGTVTLEPGVTQGQLCRFLAEKRAHFIVPTSGAGPGCSLLANALERGYGITPHADHFGALANLEVILPDGTWLRAPFASLGVPILDRLFRNGVGPSWIGLFTQSSLGIVTRATITLAPRPQRTAVFLFSLRGAEQLEEVVGRIRAVLEGCSGLVGGVNLMNRHRILAMSVPYPQERLGGERIMPDALVDELSRQNLILPWTGYGTLYCPENLYPAVVREVKRALAGCATRLVFMTPARVNMLRRVLGFAPAALAARFEASLATLAKSLELIEGVPNETALPLAYWLGGKRSTPGAALHPSRDGCGLLWYAPLVPLDGATVGRYVDWVSKRMKDFGLEPLITLTTISNGIFDSTVPLLFDRADPDATRNAQTCLATLLEEGRAQGFAPYRVGIDAMPWLLGRGGESWDFIARLKRQLDPENILAPGRYVS
jgi:FAD/FMN-containing dehydrogenase